MGKTNTSDPFYDVATRPRFVAYTDDNITICLFFSNTLRIIIIIIKRIRRSVVNNANAMRSCAIARAKSASGRFSVRRG